MLRLVLVAAVALTVMVVPMTDPATPTPDPSDCPYLRITAEERPAPSPVAEPPQVEVDAFAGCVFGDERTMTLCATDATGADHGCVRSEPRPTEEPERASLGLSATCAITSAGVAPYRLEATITDATGATLGRGWITVDTGIAC
jgi:hypothetical protein